MKPLSWNLHRRQEVESSNRELLDAIGSGNELDRDFTALLVDYQSGGQGRRGRSWYCPPGEGLLISLRFDFVTQKGMGLIALACCWALLDTLRKCIIEAGGEELPICWKWPNDLLMLGFGAPSKLAGILVQTQVQGEKCKAVCGFGVNLYQQRFPAEVDQPAISLAGAGLLPDREKLVHSLLDRARHFPLLINDSKLLREELEAWHLLRRMPCKLNWQGRSEVLTQSRLLDDGRLQLGWSGGSLIVASGELRQRATEDGMELNLVE